MTQIPEYVTRIERDMVRDMAKGHFWSSLTSATSHASLLHADLDATQMLDRMCRENKTRVSSFNTRRDLQECVSEAIIHDLPIIFERKARTNGEPFTHSVRLSDEEYQDPSDPVDFQTRHRGVCEGPDGRIRERTSDVTCMVLRRDDNAPYGFTLVSAFPDMDAKSARDTGRDIKQYMLATKSYRTATPLRQTYMELTVTKGPKRSSISYHEDDNGWPDSIVIQFPSGTEGIDHRIHLDEDGSASLRSYRRLVNGRHRAIPCTLMDNHRDKRVNLGERTVWETFSQMYPDMADYLRSTRETLSERHAEYEKRQQQMVKKQASGNVRRMPRVGIKTYGKQDESTFDFD